MTTYDTEDLTDCAENAAAELMDLKDRIQAQGRMGDARSVALRLQRDLPALLELVNEYIAETNEDAEQ